MPLRYERSFVAEDAAGTAHTVEVWAAARTDPGGAEVIFSRSLALTDGRKLNRHAPGVYQIATFDDSGPVLTSADPAAV